MAEKGEFWELYRRPEWQRKRLEIMERDGFQCVDCGAKESTLNVHHSYYEKGRKPWEYPAHSLNTLCESCHKARHKTEIDIRAMLGILGPRSRNLIEGFISGVLILRRKYCVELPTIEHAVGLLSAFMPPDGELAANLISLQKQLESKWGDGPQLNKSAVEQILPSDMRHDQSDPRLEELHRLAVQSISSRHHDRLIGFAKALAAESNKGVQFDLYNMEEAYGFAAYYQIDNANLLRRYNKQNEDETEELPCFASVTHYDAEEVAEMERRDYAAILNFQQEGY